MQTMIMVKTWVMSMGDADYHDDSGGNGDRGHDHHVVDYADAHGDYDGDDDGWAFISDMASARRRYGLMLWTALPGAWRSPGGRQIGGRGKGEEFRSMTATLPRAEREERGGQEKEESSRGGRIRRGRAGGGRKEDEKGGREVDKGDNEEDKEED